MTCRLSPWMFLFVMSASPYVVAEEAEAPGIKIGEKAPDFQLTDQNGKEQSLKAMLKKGNVALVFHRSANW